MGFQAIAVPQQGHICMFRLGKRTLEPYLTWCFMLKTKEQDVVNAILDYLSYRKIIHAHIRNTGAIIKRDGKTFFARNKRNQPGIADILGVYKGVPIAIEVKSDIGKVRPEQDDWLNKWAENGGVYCVARSVTHVEQFIESIDGGLREGMYNGN